MNIKQILPHERVGHSTYLTLTHWGQVMHICINNLTFIGSDHGLLFGWCQAIIWTNAGILLIVTLGTNFSEILLKIHIFSFKKVPLKMSFGKWWPFCLVLNMLTIAWLLVTCSYNSHLIFCLLKKIQFVSFIFPTVHGLPQSVSTNGMPYIPTRTAQKWWP